MSEGEVIAFDLFEGAGGATVGLKAAGLDVLGFELWDVAVETARANGHTVVQADLNDIDWSTVVAEHGKPDLLWASPPCQPFSSAGLQLGVKDMRDGTPAFLRAVSELLPAFVVMENVKGLTFSKHRWYLDSIVSHLQLEGYEVEWGVLNCANFGVPQTRQRLILIARRDGGPLRWPTPTHARTPGLLGELPWVSMAEALGWSGTVGFPRRADDKGEATEDGYRARDFHDTASPSPMVTGKARSWVLNTGRDWKKGGSRDDAQQIPLDQPAPTVGGVDSQWQWRRPATTVSGDPRINPPGHKINQADREAGRTHYNGRDGKEAVRVSVAEAATLQGFPDGYVFTGSRTAQFQQVGNAVPPRLAEVVVRALVEEVGRG